MYLQDTDLRNDGGSMHGTPIPSDEPADDNGRGLGYPNIIGNESDVDEDK